jgi:hypothetical protein
MKRIEEIFEEMIEQQKRKLLKSAKEIHPYIVEDDLLQPFDFPDLEKHPDFRYEEGVLAGLLTAFMAIQAAKDEITCLK